MAASITIIHDKMTAPICISLAPPTATVEGGSNNGLQLTLCFCNNNTNEKLTKEMRMGPDIIDLTKEEEETIDLTGDEGEQEVIDLTKEEESIHEATIIDLTEDDINDHQSSQLSIGNDIDLYNNVLNEHSENYGSYQGGYWSPRSPSLEP